MFKYMSAAVAVMALASPALSDSGRVVKIIGSGSTGGPNCVWFQTTAASGGIDPLKYAFSLRDTAAPQYMITINNAFGSATPPKFIVGDPGDPENFHPEDCQVSGGFVYVYQIFRGP